MSRYFSSFFLSLTIFATIIASSIYAFDSDDITFDKRCSNTKSVSFTVLAAMSQVVKEKSLKEKKKVEKKKEPIKKKIVKKIEKKKIVKKIKKEPKVVKKEQPKRELKKELITDNHTIKRENKQTVSSLAKVSDRVSVDEIKKRFLIDIREKIYKNKYYPKRARLRSIEGSVFVNFKILADGSVDMLNIKKGKRVFKKSVIKAIKKSFPVQVPKELNEFPMSVNLQIDFKLS